MTAIGLPICTSWVGEISSSGQKGIRITLPAGRLPHAAVVSQLSDWESFLLRQAGKLDASTWCCFRSFLAEIESQGIDTPTSAATADDGAIAIYWRSGSQHFEIEFEPGNHWSWFATSLSNNESTLRSGIGLVQVTPELLEKLRAVSKATDDATSKLDTISIEA